MPAPDLNVAGPAPARQANCVVEPDLDVALADLVVVMGVVANEEFFNANL